MGGALKKIAPSRGRRENIWGISFEKSRFYAKKSYFSNFRGGAQNFWGISCEKSRFYAKKIIFLPILGGGASGAPPLNPPLRSLFRVPIIYLKVLLKLGTIYNVPFYFLIFVFLCVSLYTIYKKLNFKGRKVIKDIKFMIFV